MAQVSINHIMSEVIEKKGGVGGGEKKCDSLFYDVVHYDVTIANLCLWKHRQSDIISQNRSQFLWKKFKMVSIIFCIYIFFF